MNKSDINQAIAELLAKEYLSVLQNGEHTLHPQSGEEIIKRPSANMLGKINQFLAMARVDLTGGAKDAFEKLAEEANRRAASGQLKITPLPEEDIDSEEAV